MADQELNLLFKDGSKDWICPIYDLKETREEVICESIYTYTFDKKSLESWYVGDCTCADRRERRQGVNQDEKSNG